MCTMPILSFMTYYSSSIEGFFIPFTLWYLSHFGTFCTLVIILCLMMAANMTLVMKVFQEKFTIILDAEYLLYSSDGEAFMFFEMLILPLLPLIP